MRIAIAAAGGVGGFLGARLIKAGAEVAVVARGKHLEAIRSSGLTLETPKETITVRPALATDDPAAIGPVDIVVFAVKLPDADAAAVACRPLLKPGTGVIPFQNGVEATDLVRRVLGPGPAMMGTCYIFADLAGPGRIVQTGARPRFFFGEADGVQSERSRAFRVLLEAAGVDAPVPDDVRVEVWRKFVYLSALSGLTAVSRSPLGTIRADVAMRAVFVRAMEETAAVAAAKGIALPADAMGRYLHYLDSSPPDATSSQARDLAAGKALELEFLSGAVVRLGAEVGVDTPVHTTIQAALRPFANGRA